MSVDSVHALRVELAAALRERDAEREFRGAAEAAFAEQLARTEAAESALAAANAELAIWRDEDAREAKYEAVSRRCTAAETALAAARREVEAHKEALSDLMKLINEGALVRNIGQDGEPGWTLRAMRLVMALKHAYALVPDLAAPASAPGKEG